MHPKTLYNETHQHRSGPPTSYESLLGDSIERAFAQGIHDLEGVVAYLNNAHGIEVRGTQEDGQGNTMIGVPIYHSGKADRAFVQLQKSTDLQYTRL